MAVEIRQLVIRAVVDPPRKADGEGGNLSSKDRAELVQDVVEEVRKIMKRDKLR